LAAENARAYDTARFAANHDPVTGLLNHRALHDELTRLFERATRRKTRLTVLMMDLNLFKEFNDRYGHQAGDRVLDDIGQAIKQSMPTNAVVARYGGDEFTVGIPDCPPEATQIFIATIRERVDAVQEKHGFVGEGFGVSIGVASYPEEGTELAEIIARADQSMYEDKWRLKGSVDRRRDSPLRIAPF
jgi:diguanylate cyclase (GGDEF)-like protein